MDRHFLAAVFDLLFGIIILLLAIFVLPRLVIYFIPFAVGWTIAVIANPIVRFMEKRVKITRKCGTAILMFLVITIIAAIVYTTAAILLRQFNEMALSMPEVYSGAMSRIQEIAQRFNIDIKFDNEQTTIYDRQDILSFAQKAGGWFIYIIFTIMASFFFIADKLRIEKSIKTIIPAVYLKEYRNIIDNFKSAAGGYFAAQFRLMFVMILIMFISFLILRVDNALLIAVGIGFLDFLPVFGTGIVLLPWAIYAFAVKKYYLAVGLVLVYVICLVVKQALSPKLVGKCVGIGSFTTLLLLYIGYKTGGLFGTIIAIPVGMIVINLWRAGAFNRYLEDVAYILDRISQIRE